MSEGFNMLLLNPGKIPFKSLKKKYSQYNVIPDHWHETKVFFSKKQLL